MRKLLIYIFILVLLSFLLPIIFTKKMTVQTEAVIEINEEEEIVENYNYNEYSTIRLLHIPENNVEEIPLDEYLYRSGCSRNTSNI